MSLFNELKRRNVFRVGAAYLVVAWLIVQVVGELGDIFALPAAISQTVVILLAIGFPIAILVSWVYEVTPEGIATQEAVDAGVKTTSGRKLNTVIIGGLALALVMVVLDSYVLTDGVDTQRVADVDTPDIFQGEIIQTADLEKSIAVLPFANLSNDPEQDYFADGLSEELLNRLARIQDLLVAGRTSSFYFKNSTASMSEIGEELDVAHILEGSVRKSGNQVRVSAQLIRADNGFQLWSDTFDRNLEDIFAIQDEIAEAVTTALSVTLSAGEFDRPGMTTNVQAYEAYLHADLSESPDPATNIETIRHLENAVSIDPEFGLAWNALYRAYQFTTLSLPPDQSAGYIPLAEDALVRTQQLIPNAPEYLISDAVYQRRMGNWQDAETLFLMTIDEYGNSNAMASLNYAELLWSVGRLQDALPYLQRARRLDPKQVDIATRLSVTLMALGRTEEARLESLRGIAVSPGNGFIKSTLTMLDIQEGNFQSAADSIKVAIPGEITDMIGDAIALWLAGDQTAAFDMIRRYSESRLLSPVEVSMLAPISAALGDNEFALSLYFGSANSNVNDLFGSLPIWQSTMSGMRQLEGFKDLLAMSGLTEYWRTTGNWGDFCQPLEGTDDFECF